MMISINQLSELSGIDRRTVKRRLESLPSTPGANRALLYESRDALRALFGGTGTGTERLDPQSERAKLDQARRKEIELRTREREGELLPVEMVVLMSAEVVTAARSQLLGIPSKIRGRFPEVDRELVAEVDDLIRKALTELGERGMSPELEQKCRDYDARTEAA